MRKPYFNRSGSRMCPSVMTRRTAWPSRRCDCAIQSGRGWSLRTQRSSIVGILIGNIGSFLGDGLLEWAISRFWSAIHSGQGRDGPTRRSRSEFESCIVGRVFFYGIFKACAVEDRFDWLRDDYPRTFSFESREVGQNCIVTSEMA